ncbi:MAG: hypothetical protein AAGG69_00660 [Pseudomonadota bacterium]
MTGVTDRPALFEGMGQAFSETFGNVSLVFTVDGAVQADSVMGIFRQFREGDLLEFSSPLTEGVTHKLSLAATDLPSGFNADRDSVSVNGTSYDINTLEDDGRAMVRILLREREAS